MNSPGGLTPTDAMLPLFNGSGPGLNVQCAGPGPTSLLQHGDYQMPIDLQPGTTIRLKSEPFDGVGFEATILGPAPTAWRVKLSDGRFYDIDEGDIAYGETAKAQGQIDFSDLPF